MGDVDRFSFAWGTGRQKYDEEEGDFIEQVTLEVVADEAEDLEEVIQVAKLLEAWSGDEIEKAVEEYA